MPSKQFFTPSRRMVLIGVVVLMMVGGPLWSSLFHIGERNHQYESYEVVIDNETGLAYVDDSFPAMNHRLSEDLGCGPFSMSRICALERVTLNSTVPTKRYTTNPDWEPPHFGHERYHYVLIDGQTYETRYVPNRSVTENGKYPYRLDLGLRPVPREDVLRSISLNVAHVSPTVRAAAESGTHSTHARVDVPNTPVRLADGTYHRVVYDGYTQSTRAEGLLELILEFFAPFFGVILLPRVVSHFEVNYVD
ncbi:hypothetical protein [Haloferax sp. Q22]|uniref:hypothetical protein n=1 Tax=Haloferax sp. (strain Q22) TaxID=1526048 RepID=UPI000A8EA84C|nr:hypothetical protein [Haloferax sp. Q22]